jgi:hypothetical protein
VVITYCTGCGDLMRSDADQLHEACSECRAGTKKKKTGTRDSGLIRYASRPSTGAILQDIKQNVRLP